MRGRENLNIWLVLCCLSAGITGRANTTLAEEPVNFGDANLKTAVEEKLNITDPTPDDMLDLTELMATDKNITDIRGIEYAKNIQRLNLSGNQISDISAVAGLTIVHELLLQRNLISDISGLVLLNNLRRLSLADNQISDISALAWINPLSLYLSNNHISDISALSAMTNLVSLDLRGNPLNQDAYDMYIPFIVKQNRLPFLRYDERKPTLTIFTTAGGSVEAPGEGVFAYDQGSSVPIAANADPGCHFVNWTGTAVDEGKVEDPCSANTTVIVDADYTLQAFYVARVNIIYVDDDAAGDPGPNDPAVSNSRENGTLAHPFDMIREGVDAAMDGDVIQVHPGLYQEEIDFLGKAITVQGVAVSPAGVPVLQNPGDFAVSFYSGEGPDSVLKNFIITDSFMGVFIVGSSPTISNLTVVNNKYGIEAYAGSEPDISNTILWNNTGGDLFGCQARYSFVRQVSEPLEGLIAHWKFDENQGSIAYDSAGDNHGNIHGTQRTAGQVNGALSFDGEDDYVELTDNNPVWLPQFNFSFSAWIYFEKEHIFLQSEQEVILDLNYAAGANPANELGYIILRRSGSRELCFQMTTTTNSDESLNSNEVLAAKRWRHIVAVREGGTQAIYVNGILDAMRTCSADPIDFVGGYDDDRINIGRYTTTVGHPRYHFKGKIDDVMIFDRALSAEEIQQLYQGIDGFTTTPLFADPANGDYHLRSERGRYWPEHDIWVLDKVTSSCVDGGYPYADTLNEPMPHGGRINIGAYGGTIEASLSPWQTLPLPGQAAIHSPLDGEYTGDTSIMLTWTPGENADLHDVYFGTEHDAVANATTESTGIYCGRQPLEMTTYDPGILELNKTYYWRIDEVIEPDPDNPLKGGVWSFTTADFIILDDFEEYDDDNQIWRSWQDGLGFGVPGTDLYVPANGTGAAVGDETWMSGDHMETVIVHDGRQSLQYCYDNNKPGCLNYSEATLTLDHSRDWNKEGIDVLSLWFYGDPGNIPEPMYIAVADADGQTAEVLYHDNPNSVLMRAWTEWTIELQKFSDKGVDLADVNSITIGFGYRKNPQPGGSGRMYFDDIRLCRLLP